MTLIDYWVSTWSSHRSIRHWAHTDSVRATLTTATLVGVYMGCGENRSKMYAYTYLDSHLSQRCEEARILRLIQWQNHASSDLPIFRRATHVCNTPQITKNLQHQARRKNGPAAQSARIILWEHANISSPSHAVFAAARSIVSVVFQDLRFDGDFLQTKKCAFFQP